YPRRFLFILSGLRAEIDEHRADANTPNLVEPESFETILCTKLSAPGQRVLERAKTHRLRCDGLVERFRQDRRRLGARKITSLDDRLMEASLAYEREHRKPGEGLGIAEVDDHLFLLRAYFRCLLSDRHKRVVGSVQEAWFNSSRGERLAARRAAAESL